MSYATSTCVRPSHDIYSARMERYLTVREQWLCQGLFPNDFECAQEVEQFIREKPGLAKDLVGNAMAGTVLQAQAGTLVPYCTVLYCTECGTAVGMHTAYCAVLY